jgi:MFS family permease
MTNRQDFGEIFGNSYIVPSLWLALWTAVAPIGQMAGAITGGWIQDRFGRCKSIMLGSLISAGSIAVCYVSDKPDYIDARRGVLLVGKTVLGFALGIMLATTQTYMSEVAPPRIRGPVLGLIPTGILLGQLTGAIVIWSQSSKESANSYLISIASQWPFSVASFFMGLVLPESPIWYIRRGNYDAALQSSQRLYKDEEDAQEALHHAMTSVDVEKTTQGGAVAYIDCLKGTNRRRTGIVVFASLIPIIFGLPLLAQASYFIQIVGMKASLSLVILILGIALGFIGNGIGLWVMSKIGRRPLILTSFSITTVLWLGMGVAGVWPGTFTTWYTRPSVPLSLC